MMVLAPRLQKCRRLPIPNFGDYGDLNRSLTLLGHVAFAATQFSTTLCPSKGLHSQHQDSPVTVTSGETYPIAVVAACCIAPWWEFRSADSCAGRRERARPSAMPLRERCRQLNTYRSAFSMCPFDDAQRQALCAEVDGARFPQQSTQVPVSAANPAPLPRRRATVRRATPPGLFPMRLETGPLAEACDPVANSLPPSMSRHLRERLSRPIHRHGRAWRHRSSPPVGRCRESPLR